MSVLFVALALSMFGLFEIQLPGSWSRKVARATSRAGGSLSGAALLGFGAALIVGPCVTPPLAAALIYIADTGDLLRGALALFALGLGMGLPLIAFGVIGAGLTPKSGPWLAKAKQSFGFVFLALAIWMSGRVTEPPEAFVDGLERLRGRFGMRVLGGCCGADGHHFEAMARTIARERIDP